MMEKTNPCAPRSFERMPAAHNTKGFGPEERGKVGRD
jgi:hypothetical protein